MCHTNALVGGRSGALNRTEGRGSLQLRRRMKPNLQGLMSQQRTSKWIHPSKKFEDKRKENGRVAALTDGRIKAF